MLEITEPERSQILQLLESVPRRGVRIRDDDDHILALLQSLQQCVLHSLEHVILIRASAQVRSTRYS